MKVFSLVMALFAVLALNAIAQEEIATEDINWTNIGEQVHDQDVNWTDYSGIKQ